MLDHFFAKGQYWLKAVMDLLESEKKLKYSL